ncbi:MAG: hypothetical protein ACO1SV_22995 [Fimbriimonas sp.]
MKNLVWVGAILLVASAHAQEPKEGLTRKTVKPPAATAAPVSQAEARAVFTRAEKVLRSALNLSGNAASPIAVAAKPVTRAQVVSEFNRLYKLVEPSAKLTPRPVRFDQTRIRMTGARREELVRLVRLGAVAPIGPLATNANDSLTVAEFGDALGFFLTRMAEITHMPSRKWTPALQDE